MTLAAHRPPHQGLAIYRLPVPPSANKLFCNSSNRGGRHRSKEYKAWIEVAGFELLRQRIVAVPSPFAVRLVFVGGKDWNVNRDIDNAIKPVLDLLKTGLVIVSDSCRHLVRVEASFERRLDQPASWCCVEVEAMKGEG